MVGADYDKIVDFVVSNLVKKYGFDVMKKTLIDKAESIDFENNHYATYFGVYSHYGDLVKQILEEYK